MADNEVNALKLIQEAEKKSKSGGGVFGIFGDGGADEACKLYVKAANLFKVAKKWDEAGNAFVKSAEINFKKDYTKYDAITNYTDAATCFRKTNPEAAVDCLLKTTEIYTDMGWFESAARCYVSIAEIYESDLQDIEKAMANYEKAADYYKGEESKSSANKCMLNTAGCAAQLKKYKKAIHIYEEVGVASAESSIYSANDCFFKAVLCYLCKDFHDVQDALKRYGDIHPPFDDSHEHKLIKRCVLALNEQNSNSFTNSVKDYDKTWRLDKWTRMMLFRIKKKYFEAENAGLFPDKVEGELNLVVCCVQSEWTIPKFALFVRMKQKNISHYFRSLHNPDMIWQLSIDTCRTDLGGDEIPEICFKLFLTSGLKKLYRKGSNCWADVVVVLKVNSGQTSFFDEVLKIKDLQMNQKENTIAEFCTRNCRVKIEDINKVLVDGALTLTCIVNYCGWGESVIAKYEPDNQLKLFSLSELLRNGLLPECVVIKVEDKSFTCHTKILSLHSPVFRSMFEHETKESETGVVTITDHSAEAISDLLAYMYLGKIENGDNMEELFEVADKYNVSHLKKICEQMLIKKLSIENVCRFLVLADLHSGNELKKACLEFCAENRKKIFQTNEWKMMKSTYLDLTNSVLEWMCNSY